ncbi:MAG: hypothetical protein HQL84_01595 [Magnetococcales bacterium]|nr:hypothetical protein [Magnetococcales bacterium]MBF0148720.1 hypothetical protein [Magnetococcales bacterium]MBF0173258.1 hypothetical protein [Magnetococcales bacterium]MBF0348502.1 hypothetical protein [Magnetococcales bacterium]MBF0630269.1 hypothetical protein [Magnetococcales bacterium]
MMDRLLTEPPERAAQPHSVDIDPLNLKGSYDAPAFIRLGRKLGSDIPVDSAGMIMGSEMAGRCS